MTFRKLAAAAIISLCIFTNGVCFARLSTSDLSIGGVYLDQNFSEVKSIYGNPVSERVSAGYGKIYSFANNGTVFDVHVTRSNVVKGVKISGNNGLALDSSGIKSGSPLKAVTEYYGNPDRRESAKGENGQELQVLTYQRFNKGILHQLSFYVDSASGQVVTIHFDEYYG